FELRFFHHLHLLFGWWFRLQLKDHRYVWLGTPSKSAGPTHTTFGFAVIMRALSSATVTPVDRVQRGVGWKEKCNAAPARIAAAMSLISASRRSRRRFLACKLAGVWMVIGSSPLSS